MVGTVPARSAHAGQRDRAPQHGSHPESNRSRPRSRDGSLRRRRVASIYLNTASNAAGRDRGLSQLAQGQPFGPRLSPVTGAAKPFALSHAEPLRSGLSGLIVSGSVCSRRPREMPRPPGSFADTCGFGVRRSPRGGLPTPRGERELAAIRTTASEAPPWLKGWWRRRQRQTKQAGARLSLANVALDRGGVVAAPATTCAALLVAFEGHALGTVRPCIKSGPRRIYLLPKVQAAAGGPPMLKVRSTGRPAGIDGLIVSRK